MYYSIDGMHVSQNGRNLSKHAPIAMTIRNRLDQLQVIQTPHRAPIGIPTGAIVTSK